MSDKTECTDDTPGWDAISAALRPIFGDCEPYHVGTVVPYAFGGPDPIHGISAYEVAEPIPHWHFVTYGFSELSAKESLPSWTSSNESRSSNAGSMPAAPVCLRPCR